MPASARPATGILSHKRGQRLSAGQDRRSPTGSRPELSGQSQRGGAPGETIVVSHVHTQRNFTFPRSASAQLHQRWPPVYSSDVSASCHLPLTIYNPPVAKNTPLSYQHPNRTRYPGAQAQTPHFQSHPQCLSASIGSRKRGMRTCVPSLYSVFADGDSGSHGDEIIPLAFSQSPCAAPTG